MREAVVQPSDMLITRAPWSTAKIAPLVTPSLEHTKVLSMRTFMSGQRVAAGAAGHGQLAAVEPDLAAQILVVVVHARIQHRDDDVRAARRGLPGKVGRDAARARRRGHVVVVAEEVPLPRRPVARGLWRAGGGRVQGDVRRLAREEGKRRDRVPYEVYSEEGSPRPTI